MIAIGEFGAHSFETFKSIITREFLSMQLSEAVSIARKLSAEDSLLAKAYDAEESL
jgi:hypothetical protein